MEKKLLSVFLLVFINFLNPLEGFGQCPSSVSISANPGTTICAGTSVTFTANPSGGSNPTYQWYLNGVVVNGENAKTYTNNSLSNNDKIKVIVGSTEENCSRESSVVTMTVNAAASVSFNISATKTSICPGETVTFSHGAITNGGTSPGYQWRINGNPVSGATSATFQTSNLNQGDQVTLAVSSSVQCATPVPAISNNTLQINVNELPTLSTTNAAVCASGQTSIDLKSLVSTNGNPTFYTNEANAINKTGAINSTVSPTSQTTYYVRSELSTGCFVTDSIVISINALPAVDAGPDQAICPAGSFDLASIGSGNNRTFYTSQANANSGSNQISSVVTPSSQTTYYVRSENAEGCYNTDSVTISINPLPTLSTSNASVCASGQTSIDLNTLVTTNGTASFYSSQSNADNKTNAIGATVSPTSQTTYFVRSELSTGCYTTDTIVISIDALPTLTVTNGSVCANNQTSIDLGTLVTTNGTTVSYHSSQANADANSSAINAVVSPSATTTYYVRSANSQGCYNTAAIQISINALPTVNAGADQTICIGTSFDLSSIASGNGTLSYYTSQANADNKTNALSSATVSPTTATTYYVRSESPAGCYSTDAVVINVDLDATITLTSANNEQVRCVNSSIAAINYTIGEGGTGANVTGLPPGVTSSYNSTTKVFTISGTPTAAGTFNFQVTTTGCGEATAIGKIQTFATQPAAPTITGAQLLCPIVNGLIYSVPENSNVLSYSWTVPSGFTITAGAGTNQITVNATSSARSGNITVNVSNPCGNSSSSLPVDVDTFASADAGPDIYICTGTTSVTMNGEVGGVIKDNQSNTYAWSDNGAGGRFETSGSTRKTKSTYILPPTAKAGDIITITLSTNDPAGDCGPGVDEMKIYILTDPQVNLSVSDNRVCSGDQGDIIFTGTPNTTVTYNVNAGTSQTIDIGSSGIAILNSGTLSSTTTYNLVSARYTSGTACSKNLSGSISIEVDELTTAEAGDEIIICQSSNPVPVSLSGASIGGGATTGAWSITNGGGTLSSLNQTANPETVTYTPAVDFTGTITLTLTTNAPGECQEVSDTRIITVEPAPTVEAGEALTVCQSSNPAAITLTGASIGGGASTAAWSITSGGGTLSSTSQTSSPQSVTYTPAADFYGEIVLTLTSNAPGSCDEITDTRIITVDPVPIVVAGPQEIVCQAETPEAITLSGASVGGGGSTAAWSITSGGGNLSSTNQTANPETITYTPAAGFSGTVTLTLTSNTPGICTAVTDTREIVIEQAPMVTAGEDIFVCHSSNPEAIALSGATIGGGATTGVWTITSGEGTLSNSSPTATPQNITFTPASTFVGEIILTLTTDAPGTCQPVSEIRTITINEAATVDAGEDMMICSNETANMVGAFGGGATSGTWTSSGTGTFSNNNPNAVYTPSTADINNGSVTLTYTTNDPDGPCGAASDSILLTIKEEILITTQPQNVGVCVTNPASLSVVAYGDDLTYQWFKGTSPGTAIQGATSATLDFTQASLNDAGTYYVVVGDGTTCSAITSNEVTLNVNQDISIDTQPVSQVVCIGSDVTFSVVATGAIDSYIWRKNGVEIPNEFASTLTITGVSLNDADIYDVVIYGEGGTCEAAYSAPVVLTVQEEPVAEAGDNFEVCSTVNSFVIGSIPGVTAASASNHTSLVWTTSNGGGIIGNETSLDATYQPVEADYGQSIEFILTAIVEIDGQQVCTTAVDTKQITIIPQPVITEFSYISNNTEATSGEFCETDEGNYTPHTAGDNLTNGTGSFTVDNNALTINSSTGEFTPAGTPPGIYIVTYSFAVDSQEAECTIAEKTFTVTIGEKPVADFTYGEDPFCSDSENILPIFPEADRDIGVFSSTTGLVFADTSTGEIDVAASTPGTYEVTNTIDYSAQGCAVVIHTASITINEKPIADFSYPAAEYCSDDPNPVAQLTSPAVAGVFSELNSDTGLVFVDAATGEIDLASSTPGTYTIVNTVYIDGDGCDPVTAEYALTIQKLPDASFNYPAAAYCQSSGVNPDPVINGDTGGVFTASAGLVIDANGKIDLAASAANDPNDETDVHTVTYTFASNEICQEVSTTVEVRIDAPAIGGELTFGEFGRLFTTCEITDRNTGLIADLILIDFYGKIDSWNYKTFSGEVLSVKNNDGTNFTGSTLPGSKIESLGLSETTVFQVILSGGSCTAAASKSAILSVISSDIDPTPVTADKFVVCIDDPVLLSAESGYEQGADIGEGGSFDNSSITNHGWKIIRSDGSEGNFNSSADNGRAANWLRTNPVDLWTANINNPSNSSLVRYDTGATDGNRGFAAVSGNFPGSKLITPVFSITSMDQAILTFDQAYNLTEGSYIMVEITTDGGATWQQIYIKTGPANSGHANNFGGGDINSRPENKIEIDLSAYMGMNNLQIRFHYQGKRDGNVWVVDEIDIPNGPANVSMVWTDYTNPNTPVVIGTNFTETWYPTEIGWNTSTIVTTLEYSNGSCETATNAEEIKVFAFDKYITSVNATFEGCGNYSANLTASTFGTVSGEIPEYPTPDGYMGRWKIEGGAYELANADPSYNGEAVNNPNVIIKTDNLQTLNVSWELFPTAKNEEDVLITNPGCQPTLEVLEVNFEPCIALDFDGIDDYVDLGNEYNSNYSIEAWIRPEASSGTIISTPNLEINMEDLPNTITPNGRWFHIAVTDGKLYVDGILTGNFSKTGGARALIGAKWNNATLEPTNFFSGWIEEVRIWNGTIPLEQIRFLMNQRLQNNANIGVEIPMPSPGLAYDALAGYYQLVVGEINNGFTPDLAGTVVNGRLKNMETFQENTAPLPYTSATNNVWSNRNTWTQPVVWDFPNSKGINGDDIEWNIVRTSNDITSGGKDITVLGLISESGKLTIMDPNGTQDEYNSGQFLRVTHYLKLDGIIDLEGESQLLQDTGSIVDNASSGYLDRDQQGNRNSYIYNYWSSPVSTIGSGSNGGYTIKNVLHDAQVYTSPNPITFAAGHAAADGARANPAIISTYWLYTYAPAPANEYSLWKHIGENGGLKSAEGFTMKGTTGAAGVKDDQNYTFRGLPHNGDISLPIGPGLNYLIGNPYPSAMDARQFILDNMNAADVGGANNTKNVFDGAIYLWDHFQEVDHYLAEYIGGYATFNLTGGVKAVSNDPRINDNDNISPNTPGRYIAVGQGFLVNSSQDVTGQYNIAGGDILFKNSQRKFVIEGGNANSIFLSPEITEDLKKEKKEAFKKIRLSFSSPIGYHRQILVGAIPHTTNGFDLGYDAFLYDDNVEDMYWVQEKNHLVIQAVPNFDKDQVLPLGIKIKENKPFRIRLDTLENGNDSMNIYLNDKLNDSIHDLRASAYISESEPGTFNERFEIIFFKEEVISPAPNPGDEVAELELFVKHSYEQRELQILNPHQLKIENLYLFDINGNQLQDYGDITNEKEVRLPVRNYSSGVYILKLYAEGKVISKKIIIRN